MAESPLTHIQVHGYEPNEAGEERVTMKCENPSITEQNSDKSCFNSSNYIRNSNPNTSIRHRLTRTLIAKSEILTLKYEIKT